MSEQQVSDILDNKRVLGPQKQILEVKNALIVYDKLSDFNANNESDFLKAHKFLMSDLISSAGHYRKKQVGIFKDKKVSHMAPSAKLLPKLLKDLFVFYKIRNTLG